VRFSYGHITELVRIRQGYLFGFWKKVANFFATGLAGEYPAKRDAEFTMDELKRLMRAQEGTLAAGSIATTYRYERWRDGFGNLALSQTGNWTRGGFDRSLFDQAQTASAEVSHEVGAAWLRLLPVAPAAQVIVRWDASTIVRTNWKVFTDYWDDFCYPSSADVAVFPQSGEWLLMFYHWEEFEWCRIKQRGST
jgi:hypothetical protein